MLLWQIYVPKKDELKFYYLSFFFNWYILYCLLSFQTKIATRKKTVFISQKKIVVSKINTTLEWSLLAVNFFIYFLIETHLWPVKRLLISCKIVNQVCSCELTYGFCFAIKIFLWFAFRWSRISLFGWTFCYFSDAKSFSDDANF